MIRTPYATTIVGVVTSAILVSALVPTGAAFAANGPSVPTVAPVVAGEYLIQLKEPATSDYLGTVSGYPATSTSTGHRFDANSADAEHYESYLASNQITLAASVGAAVELSYTVAVNGFSATLTSAQATTLMANPQVKSFELNQTVQPTAVTVTPSTDYLKLSGATGVWSKKIGSLPTKGNGMIVGIIDTGIDSSNPSFAGNPIPLIGGATQPGDTPGLSRTATLKSPTDNVTYLRENGRGNFKALCPAFDAKLTVNCNQKVIGLQTFCAKQKASPRADEGQSDGGHGSHTAGIAAGNANVETGISDTQPISGVAPEAKIAVYKITCAGVPSTSKDIVAAVNMAVKNGVDVINYSMSNRSKGRSFVSLAFRSAVRVGIVVVAAAGNRGAKTVGNVDPGLITVANSSLPTSTVEKVLTISSPHQDSFPGTSRVDFPNETKIVLPSNKRDISARVCQPGYLDPRTVAGKIVVCSPGASIDVLSQSVAVKNAGGVGMISADATEELLATLKIPTFASTVAITEIERLGYLWADVVFSGNWKTVHSTKSSIEIHESSSTGPSDQGNDFLKPDLAAPGVNILSATKPANGLPAFEYLTGTSMATPQVAGLALLYLQAHPTATPAEVKSVFMTTAGDAVTGSTDPATIAFAQGAGVVNPEAAFGAIGPGLIYDISGAWWDALNLEDTDSKRALNLPSISFSDTFGSPEKPISVVINRKVTAVRDGTYSLTVSPIPGFTATTKIWGGIPGSNSVMLTKGQVASFTVIFARNVGPVTVSNGVAQVGWATPDEEWTGGTLLWTGSDAVRVRSPIVILPLAPDANTNALQQIGVPVLQQVSVNQIQAIDVLQQFSSTQLRTATQFVVAAAIAVAQFCFVQNLNPAITGKNDLRLLTSAGKLTNFVVPVTAGTRLAQFSAASAETGTNTFTVTVGALAKNGTPIGKWYTQTGKTATITLVDPPAGNYQMTVTPAAQTPAAAAFVPTVVMDSPNSGCVTPTDAVTGMTQTSPSAPVVPLHTESWNFPASPKSAEWVGILYEPSNPGASKILRYTSPATPTATAAKAAAAVAAATAAAEAQRVVATRVTAAAQAQQEAALATSAATSARARSFQATDYADSTRAQRTAAGNAADTAAAALVDAQGQQAAARQSSQMKILMATMKYDRAKNAYLAKRNGSGWPFFGPSLNTLWNNAYAAEADLYAVRMESDTTLRSAQQKVDAAVSERNRTLDIFARSDMTARSADGNARAATAAAVEAHNSAVRLNAVATDTVRLERLAEGNLAAALKRQQNT